MEGTGDLSVRVSGGSQKEGNPVLGGEAVESFPEAFDLLLKLEALVRGRPGVDELGGEAEIPALVERGWRAQGADPVTGVASELLDDVSGDATEVAARAERGPGPGWGGVWMAAAELLEGDDVDGLKDVLGGRVVSDLGASAEEVVDISAEPRGEGEDGIACGLEGAWGWRVLRPCHG